MNISETNRHAIAIAEAWLRSLSDGASHRIQGASFEINPKSEIHHGISLNPLYEDDFRIIEVTISRFGNPSDVLEITLMKHYRSHVWQTAMIEHHVVGWVSGSYQHWARLTNEGWQVRELDRFARAESCGHFEFDYDWCETRALRAEKAARESAPTS